MNEQVEPIRVAIACQGGGSHTAFTAGVLGRLLQPDVMADHEIVALSGTSGGAICALLAWSALVDGEPEKAESLLHGFWSDNSASTVPERMLNWWVLWAGQMANYVATPAVSPYVNPASVLALDHLRSLLQRWVDFDRLNQPGTDSAAPKRPLLVLGAVDVMSGVFKAFDSRRGEITADAVLASAAIPTLFRSVPVDGGLYWDGLFSQNPPVRDLLDAVRTRSGWSKSTRRSAAPNPAPWWRSPIAATSWPEICPCIRSCISSRRSTSCSRKANWWATGTDRSPSGSSRRPDPSSRGYWAPPRR